MSGIKQFIVFSLDETRYALPLPVVERVVHAVEITPLPDAPDAVSGVIDVQGRIIPVINIRKLFRKPERDVELTDNLIIIEISRRTIALMVDAIVGIIDQGNEGPASLEDLIPEVKFVRGVIRSEGGLVMVYDPEVLFSEERMAALGAALMDADGRGDGALGNG